MSVRQREAGDGKIIAKLCNVPRRVGTETDRERKKTPLVPHRGAAEVRLYLLFSIAAALKHFLPLDPKNLPDPLCSTKY